MTISHVTRCLSAVVVQLLGSAVDLHAQSALPCDCPSVFRRLVSRVESDYIAYRLEVSPSRRPVWLSHVARVQAIADSASVQQCSWALRELLGFFKDGHLGIVDQPTPDSAGVDARLLARRRHVVDRDSGWVENAILRDLAMRRAGGDSIAAVEGVWIGPSYRIAVRLAPGSRTEAIGVLLASSDPRWAVGEERAQFTRVGGKWRGTVWNDLGQPITSPIEFSRGALLRMAPLLWRRGDAHEPQAFLDSTNARLPRVVFPDDSTAVVSVLSFDPAYAKALSAVIDIAWTALRERRRVVIDLRGNEGGSSSSAAPLLPFLWKEPGENAVAPNLDLPVVVSSPTTIAFWERAGWAPAGLVDRLRASPGNVVPFDPGAAPLQLRQPGRLSRSDQAVFVLTDGATVSAAEQVVLWARQLGRATIVGTHTAGSIDYQSAWLQRIACGSMGQLLILPALARSMLLPAGGFNATGIAPDVTIRITGDWLGGLPVAR